MKKVLIQFILFTLVVTPIAATTSCSIFQKKIELDGLEISNETFDNSVKNENIITELRKKSGLSKIQLDIDVLIEIKKAEIEKYGIITIISKKESKLVTGKKIILINPLKKVNINTLKINLDLTNETTERQIISELKKVDGLHNLENNVDVKIKFKKATVVQEGELIISSIWSSAIVFGQQRITFNNKKIDISNTLSGIIVNNEIKDFQIIRELQKVQGLEKIVLNTDVQIDIQKASIGKEGYILVSSVEKSKLVTGNKNIKIPSLDIVNLNKTLNSFKPTNKTTESDIILELKQIDGLQNIKYKNDFTINITKAVIGKSGKIVVSATNNSKLVKESKIIEIPYLKVVNLNETLNSFKPTNKTTESDIIFELRKIDGLEKIESSKDVNINIEKSTTSSLGLIFISSLNNELISGTKTLIIPKVVLKNLNSLLMYKNFYNETTGNDIIEELRKTEGLELIELGKDIKFSKVEATILSYGEIYISASDTSQLVKGEKRISINKLQRVDLSKTLTDFIPTNNTTEQDIIEELRKIIGLENIKSLIDIKITIFKAENNSHGSIIITPLQSSKLVLMKEKILVIDKNSKK